eukprot:g25868.t1
MSRSGLLDEEQRRKSEAVKQLRQRELWFELQLRRQQEAHGESIDALRDEAFALRKCALLGGRKSMKVESLPVTPLQSLPHSNDRGKLVTGWQQDPLMHLTQRLRSELEAFQWDGNGEEVKPNQVDDAEFLASPQWKCFTLVVVGFTPVFGVILAMPHLLAELHVEPHTWSYWLHYGFGSWISIQFLYNFLATQWRDPGNCKSIKPSQEVTGQFELGGGDDAPRLLYASNWCTKCSNWKPPRSHHCRSCNRCILRMDHHCPFTGNCIGAFNHGHFVLFYIFAFIGLTYSLVLSLMAAYTTDHASRWTELILPKYKEHKDTVGKHFMTGLTGVAVSIILEVLRRKGWEVMIQLAASVLAFIPVLGTGVPAFQMACPSAQRLEGDEERSFLKVTLEETALSSCRFHFLLQEYVQLKAQVYCPLGPGFYRQSGRENLKMILGKRWWIRLLFPVPGQLDMDLFLAPPPSQAGLEEYQALLQRIEQVKDRVLLIWGLSFAMASSKIVQETRADQST